MEKITTTKYKDIISKVYIDDRENERIDYAIEQYEDFNPCRERLDIGDYIFENPEGLQVVFEYKTGSDFLSSITEDNHLHNQVVQMVQNYDYTFVIVEVEDLRGEMQDRYYSTGIDISLPQINGAISTFCTESTVLFTQTKYQAFDLMMRMAGKIFKNKPLRYKYGVKSTNTALNYLTSIKGLDKKAENIVNTLDLHTLTDLLDLTVEDLVKVDLVGESTAKKILKEIRGSPHGL